MAAVLPMKSMLPRVGHKVVVQVGQPLDVSHISCRCNQAGEEQEQVGRGQAALQAGLEMPASSLAVSVCCK